MLPWHVMLHPATGDLERHGVSRHGVSRQGVSPHECARPVNALTLTYHIGTKLFHLISHGTLSPNNIHHDTVETKTYEFIILILILIM